MTKKKMDQELIVGCGIMAALAAIGIVFFILLLFGWHIEQCNQVTMVTVYFVLTGMIWGILLCRNC